MSTTSEQIIITQDKTTVTKDVENDIPSYIAIMLKGLIYLFALVIGISIFVFFSPTQAHAAEQLETYTTTENTIIGKYDYSHAQDWGLSKEQWKRYVTLMQGPRGLWSPNLDPITVLGLNARSKEERMMYANMAAQQELKRVGKELAFQHAYDAAIRKIMKEQHLQPIDLEMIKNRKKKTNLNISEPGDRILYFTNLKCDTCTDIVSKIAQKEEDTNTNPLDVYIVGKASDEEIRTWAKKAKIDPRLVKERRVTLNRNNGVYEDIDLENGETKSLPLLLLRQMSNGELKRIHLIDIGL